MIKCLTKCVNVILQFTAYSLSHVNGFKLITSDITVMCISWKCYSSIGVASVFLT